MTNPRGARPRFAMPEKAYDPTAHPTQHLCAQSVGHTAAQTEDVGPALRDLRRMRRLAYLLMGLFLAKATAVVLFVLPYSTLAGETGVLAWLREAYDVRLGLLIVTGAALYGAIGWMAFASMPRHRRIAQPGPANEAAAGSRPAGERTPPSHPQALRPGAPAPASQSRAYGTSLARVGAGALFGIAALASPTAEADAAASVDDIFQHLDACIAAVDAEFQNGVYAPVDFVPEQRGKVKWWVGTDQARGLRVSYAVQKVLNQYPKYTCDVDLTAKLTPAAGKALSDQIVAAAGEKFGPGKISIMLQKFETCGQDQETINITAFKSLDGTLVGIGAFKLMPQKPDCGT